MTARIFVLPTQDDIIDFRLGNRPTRILVREFASEAELDAYRAGIEAIGDLYDRIESLDVVGSKVRYSHRLDDPEVDADVTQAAEEEFETPAEAEAYRAGMVDAEGLMAPLLIDDSDDRFEQLLAWTAPAPTA